MMMYLTSRIRPVDAPSLALPALCRAQTVGGVRLGVQTYCFRELPRPAGGDVIER